jgi:HEAT repeat protein
MGLLGNRRPNVKLLARKKDLEGLVDAVFYEEVVQEPNGVSQDVGALVREEAVLALAAFGPDRAGGAVMDALGDRSDRGRSAAVRVLYEWGDPLPLAEAAARLPADRGQARALALRAVRELKQPESAAPLASALVHADHEQPLRAGDADLLVELLQAKEARRIGARVVEMLASALGDERPAVAARAEELLVRLAPDSTRAVAAALLRDTPTPRAAAVLARIGDGSCLMPLANALGHADPQVRAESAVALGELRDPAAVEPLMRAARDPDHTVRRQAGAALDRIGTTAVILGLAAVLRPALAEAVKAAKPARQAPKKRSTARSARATGGPKKAKEPARRATHAKAVDANGSTAEADSNGAPAEAAPTVETRSAEQG